MWVAFAGLDVATAYCAPSLSDEMLRICAPPEVSLVEEEANDERRGRLEEVKLGDGTSLGAVKFMWALLVGPRKAFLEGKAGAQGVLPREAQKGED
jgi:hypothetical protein